jgi:NAD-dependent dihydropyrimidine dehydrogenase PreA subunit
MLAHVIAGEQSGPRLWLLKLYARHEVLVLSVLYRLLGSRLLRWRLTDELIYWTLAYPAARWGIAGTPMSPGELDGFFSEGAAIGVGPCRCRLAHVGCPHPLETDIVVRTGFGVWKDVFGDDYRRISKAEALRICGDSHAQGMAQIAFAHLDMGDGGSYFVMCNCCADGCLPLLSRAHYGHDRYPMRRGKRRSFVESEKCRGCGTCVEACVFGCRSIGRDGAAEVEGCYGCGLCVSHCPEGASGLV